MSRKFFSLFYGSAMYIGLGYVAHTLVSWQSGRWSSVTTIATFLMVFQKSQHWDGLALQIKIDEIITAVGTAYNGLSTQPGPTMRLNALKAQLARVAVKARNG